MKKIIIFAIVILTFFGCSKYNSYVVFDTPHVYFTDEGGLVSEMVVDNASHNLLTPVHVKINASNQYFQEPITIHYEVVCGEGLQENVDYKIQYTSQSPLVFEKGTYEKVINIVWLKNQNLDTSKDCTLVFKFVSCSQEQIQFGLPGPSQKHKTFKFIKVKS